MSNTSNHNDNTKTYPAGVSFNETDASKNPPLGASPRLSGGGGAAYIKDVFNGLKSLFIGLRRTFYYFTHHKEIITQQYPDNRDTMLLPERFKGEVVMLHDENNEHACTGCTACELACPNATIKIITKFDVSPEGKKKKAIDKFVYHLELCTMCNLCIVACPTDAIKMAQTFEHSVYNRADLTKILNKPASKIREGVE